MDEDFKTQTRYSNGELGIGIGFVRNFVERFSEGKHEALKEGEQTS